MIHGPLCAQFRGSGSILEYELGWAAGGALPTSDVCSGRKTVTPFVNALSGKTLS